MATANFTVTVDTGPAVELGTRVKEAILDTLTTARATGQPLDDDALAGLTASAVVAELLRVVPSPTAAVEAERDGAYRERAHLVAWLANLHDAVIAPAPDVDEPGWQIVYVYAAGDQLSWHIHPRDAELFQWIEHVAADDPRAQWDQHTTEEKYERVRVHIGLLSTQCGPACSEMHRFDGRCRA